ncbi:MAG TPA: protein kinase [Pyrinomonadaceae bacterium]|nr:protein kinase [Pyrinomonadaceae bacterium]
MIRQMAGSSQLVETIPSPGSANLHQDIGSQFYSKERANALVGYILEGKYRLDNLLGTGGMSEVYRATRLHIGDEVAIKILHPQQGIDRHAAERFRREAQIAARLKHPNVVSIYDFGLSVDGLMYLVMELVDGYSLRQIIKQQGPLTIAAAAEVTTQVCSALDEAHRHNIIHRDIKPDNIIFNSTEDGLRIKVLDFGIAKLRDLATSNLTQAGSVMGTPYYMSPEQCMGEELDGRSDIYSMGILLYEVLCGSVPFKSPTPSAVVVQHVTQAPAPLRSVNLSIPAAVEVVVLHALEKKREARPQTAKALAQEMKAAVLSAVAAHSTVPTEANLSPVTASSSAFTPPGVTIPFVRSSSVTGSGDIGPRVPKFLGGQTAHTKGNRLRTLMLVGIALLVMGTAAGGVAGWMLWTRWENSKPKQEVVSKQPNEAPPRNPQTHTASDRVTPQNSATGSADSEFNALRDKRSNATPAQRPEIEVALKSAESKYPSDYRFTYERAKLSVSRPGHGETFNLLFQAGQKAIDNGKANDMLSDLMRDKDADFYRLSKGHSEWNVLLEALRRSDKEALKITPHHHQ